jgi:uncharacterized protein (TIRG00374 family)
MSQQGNKTKKWLMFALRWGVAIAGITWVVYNLHFTDRVKVLPGAAEQRVLAPSEALADLQVIGNPPENAAQFRVWGSLAGEPPGEHLVDREQVWTTRSTETNLDVLSTDGRVRQVNVLAVRPATLADGKPIPPRVLVQDPATKAREIIDPVHVVRPRHYVVSQYPLIELGLNRMAREADLNWLLAALLVMPISYLITSYRWHLLLETLEIHVRQSRTFVLNMVGAFYNSFMPGSTGGDVAKAYYASKHTNHRTRAVMSVLVDRAIGLLALVILGGTMAAFQYNDNADCRRVAKASGLMLAATVVGLLVFYHRGLRRLTGLDWLIRRLPMQKFVHNAVHTMELYGRRPGRMAFALLLCFPVHVTTIISATFAGRAFGLNVPDMYYWVVVPVIALVGAIPISPQGAGVMEFFAIKLLTIRHPVSVGQAVALVMSIRLVQMFWNLVAGLFVLRGGYHAPTEKEQHELEDDEEDDDELGAVPTQAPAVTSSQAAVPIPARAEPSVGG